MKHKIPPRTPLTVFLYESGLLELVISLLDVLGKITKSIAEFRLLFAGVMAMIISVISAGILTEFEIGDEAAKIALDAIGKFFANWVTIILLALIAALLISQKMDW